ncbi:MAG: hypothetical protein ACI4KG_02775 [Oscillospiraceae bacterium]
MTKEERKRALMLEKISRKYCRTGIMSSIVFFEAIAALITTAALFPIMAAEDSLFILLPFHIFIMGFMSIFFMIMSTSLIGDSTFFSSSANNNALRLSVSGSFTTGEFLSTLPFKAKDMMNLKLINFEKQFIVNILSVIIIEAALMVAESFGYTTSLETGGLSVIALLVSEIMLLTVLISQNKHVQFIFGGMSVLITFAAFMGFAAISDGAENSAEMAERFDMLKALGIFTGVPGIIIITVFAALIIFAGEYFLKNKKDVSWNLR